jgi:hypothetical protein
MKLFLISFITVLLIRCNYCSAQRIPKVSSGKIIRIEKFHSKYVKPRNIDVWLPENYDTTKKYAVLYMQDGQMLFDSTITPNRQEWQVDEIITDLNLENKIRDCIVVGIFSIKKYRVTEFVPRVALNGLLEPEWSNFIRKRLKGKPLSDNYLKFLVSELKPYIDKTFSTKTDPANTAIMGSSAGGLISVYAFCKYPEIFGCAGCFSTGWPLASYSPINRANLNTAFREYLFYNLPRCPKGKIYFDYGNEKLCKLYQILVDSVMNKAGYDSENWITREFPNDNHSEKSWSRRLHLPLEFLLPK